MSEASHEAIAVVGVGAILPDAPDAATFWTNLVEGRYSISEVTADRWNPAWYFDDDHAAPDKTYSKIGGWVREFAWDPMSWRLPIPPKVADAMDDAQKWAISCTRAVLADYGWPERALPTDRTAVIFGNAMAGENHYRTALRVDYPVFANQLEEAPSFKQLPSETRTAILEEAHDGLLGGMPEITEDTMPGELANIIAGRVANIFDLHGPNFVTDAACASAMAALDAAIEGLEDRAFDAVITGGIDRNMGASTFVKFCKIGALSATGTRPYADGADGFVMGEGAALFMLKRLSDAERDGDKIYAVIRAVAGSSDGKGKGITAPNPLGQRRAIERAWQAAGLDPATASYMEGHGTSTRVGDVAECEALAEVLTNAGAAVGSIGLGSVKSNIGHLKGAAGAAGILKTVLALHHKELPPSLSFTKANPNIDFASSPLRVVSEREDWKVNGAGVRRAGVSAFGFGGTNFHAVLEEYVPGRLSSSSEPAISRTTSVPTTGKQPLRGAVLVGGVDDGEVSDRLRSMARQADLDDVPAPTGPSATDLGAPVRVGIDYGDSHDLSAKALKAADAIENGNEAAWRILNNQGVFIGRGDPHPIAFLYTGQGSQYVNMLAGLRQADPIVAKAFDDADRVMTPLLGQPLTDFIFSDRDDRIAELEEHLKQTEITQPAVLTTDFAITSLLAAYGVTPDMVMGHSLGEYGALVAAGALRFDAALEAVSARGREMADLTLEDNGAMAAVMAPLETIQQVVDGLGGYAVIANVNSNHQAVVGGATAAVEAAIEAFHGAGHTAIRIPVSHAFHTEIVRPASVPLCEVLHRLDVREPILPVVANVTGEFYPSGGEGDARMLDLLGRQVASPVQFVKGLETLYAAGARVFLEVGPKKALHGFVEDVLGNRGDAIALFTNHPKQGDLVSFNRALVGLWATGHGGSPAAQTVTTAPTAASAENETVSVPASSAPVVTQSVSPASTPPRAVSDDTYRELGHLFAEFLDRGRDVYEGQAHREHEVGRSHRPVVITGAGLGLPGTKRMFEDDAVRRILDGEQLIDQIPSNARNRILEKHIVRLVKSETSDPVFHEIDTADDVIKLAGRAGTLDLTAEFGVEADRVAALDTVTQLAIGAGLEALRDAGIPLVMHYKRTSVGSQLPERWMLPHDMRDDTGVIFASAFPGLDALVTDLDHFHEDKSRREKIEMLEHLQARVLDDSPVSAELDHELHELRADLEAAPFQFDRRFLFRVLAMGHSQFAEIIGARGPNTQVNSACASTTQAVALAQDWINVGRCRRVIVVAGDNASSDHLIDWIGSGFLASGAAATDGAVEQAALPFDNRRHGMILGMGAAALVVEHAGSAAERGITPICEVLGTATANSAFHGTKLDVEHIGQVMEQTVRQAEARGVSRTELAPATVFVSHETYTPARGGSASAEINALRHVFGEAADQIVIANTKGFTGHPMGVGIEDVVAVKTLETSIVPPVPNFQEIDPTLGELNLSTGGSYPVRYALRLAAGFGSQISMMLLRWTPPADGRHREPDELGYEYRADPTAWPAWLRTIGGADAEVEIVQHRLRLVDNGAVRVLTPAAAEATAPISTPAQRPVAASSDGHPPSPTPEPVAVPTTGPAPSSDDATTEPLGGDPVQERVMAEVAAATGYPADMLELDLDLEADLGIDTVKQAEVFGAIREAFGIERDENLRLRDYPTLGHVIGFVHDRADITAARVSTPTATTTQDLRSPVASEAPGGDPVQERVMAEVAAATGYPADMLELDLDLEADLGIDTVKQAEVFGAIREAFGIERDENLRLRDYPTLGHVIEFVHDRAATGAPTAGEAAASDVASAAKAAEPLEHLSATRPEGSIDAADAVPRRVPVPELRPTTDRCVRTGVELGKGARVVIGADAGGVAEALGRRLEAEGVDVLTIEHAAGADGAQSRIAAWRAGEPITGLYWLAGLDVEPGIDDLDADEWREATRTRVKVLYAITRQVYDDLDSSDRFVLGATRLGGQHGYGAEGATAPIGGAVTGFLKTLKREKTELLVKVVDSSIDDRADAIADRLVAETLLDPGCVEVGYHDEHRWTVGLEPRSAHDGSPGMDLTSDTVFVITGAAGSIVTAITGDLARHSGGTFYLLDLTPEPDPHDDDLRRFVTDRDALKRDLAERLKNAGERVTPVMIDRELAKLERLEAAQAAIEAVRDAGGTAHYRSVDLTDPSAVASVIDEIRADHGRIDVLVHAAGLEVSHFLPDKEPAEFDLVFDVKCNGWFNLLQATRDLPLGATVVFSSIAGRFGNGGQADYSAANDLMCKCTSALRTLRPKTRAIALDWTAWAGIGMAARGSIPKMMAMAGIEMLPPDAGIATVRRELTAGATAGEAVIGGTLGILVDEIHPTGGLDLTNATVSDHGPLLGEVIGMGVHSGFEVDTTLDPAAQPFLDDHRIDGTAVLPGVMGIEAFAEVASLAAPGYDIVGVEDVAFLAPCKFYRDEPRTITLRARPYSQGEQLVVRCELIGRRRLANQDEQVTTHFTGTVRLARGVPARPDAEEPPELDGEATKVEAPDIYNAYFHERSFRVLARAWRADGLTIGVFADDLPADHQPSEQSLIMAPRLIELCFQTAGVQEMGLDGRLALPTRVGRVECFADPTSAKGRLVALVRQAAPDGSFDCTVVDENGVVFARALGYGTTALPEPLSDDQAAPFAAAMHRDALANDAVDEEMSF